MDMAGLWTAGPLTDRAGQGRMTAIMLQQAKEQPYRSFQLTQSIYTRETSVLCWPEFNTAAESPDHRTLKLLCKEDI